LLAFVFLFCVFVFFIFVGREWGPVKFCLFGSFVYLFVGRGDCEVNICLFLWLFVGGRGVKVLVCWFACFGLVCVFGCLIVGLFFQTFKFRFRFAHLLSFPSRPRSMIACGAPIRFAHSDSDIRFRFQIQIQISDLRFRFARSNITSSNPKTIKQTNTKTRPGSSGRAPREICAFKFRSQIQISDSDSDLRSQIHICMFINATTIPKQTFKQTHKGSPRSAPLRFARSDSDLRFRSQIRISDSDLITQIQICTSSNYHNPKTNKQTNKPTQAPRIACPPRSAAPVSEAMMCLARASVLE